MPSKNNLPRGMRVRRDRNKKSNYYFVDPEGKEVPLGCNLELALPRWAEAQERLLTLTPPLTSLGLVGAFERCSLPMQNRYAASRRKTELAVLRRYLSYVGDPRFQAIGNEHRFLTWCSMHTLASAPDDVVRLMRLIWRFALRLQFVRETCPWKSLDLRKARLRMEVADVIHAISPSPLKEFLEEILGKSTTPATRKCDCPDDPNYLEQLQTGMQHAAIHAVAILRKSGRLDLVAPAYQLTLEHLLELRNSTILPFVRPPGFIRLDHRRREVLGLLKSNPCNQGRCRDGQAESLSV